MREIGGDQPTLPPLPHPRCPSCGVPMWLVSVQRFADGDPAKDRLHYECKVCDAKAVVPPLDTRGSSNGFGQT